MENKDFQLSIISSKNVDEVFAYLINPKNWWVGIFNETIEGSSKNTNDEFSFRAGDGVHYSHQRLIETISGERIVWLVTESNLSYLKNTNEWAGTKICFDIKKQMDKTKITFTHIGLIPNIECYGSCSGAWTQYMENLQQHLK